MADDEGVEAPMSENPESQDSPMAESRESTTMRFPSVAGPEIDAPETDHVLTRADQATVDALRPGTALLVVLRGPNTGARFLLDDASVTSGRHPDSDIFLDDVTVSRKHAVFTREGDTFSVRDVGSLNGTYVNRERIDEATLHTGDEVQIGKFRLVFYAGRPQS
ncbi:MAG: FHA domain-containing protein [Actinomycetales bacterium]|nr:FHA domain-containing protein [Actinomycetales bacterium]